MYVALILLYVYMHVRMYVKINKFLELFIFRYIWNKSINVDQRLLHIHLPNFIARQPRSIKQRKFWKGTIMYL